MGPGGDLTGRNFHGCAVAVVGKYREYGDGMKIRGKPITLSGMDLITCLKKCVYIYIHTSYMHIYIHILYIYIYTYDNK